MRKPPNILDPAFTYVPAAETDIRKTFKRVRREIEAEKQKPRKVFEITTTTAFDPSLRRRSATGQSTK